MSQSEQISNAAESALEANALGPVPDDAKSKVYGATHSGFEHITQDFTYNFLAIFLAILRPSNQVGIGRISHF